jgi:hypothetical protein
MLMLGWHWRCADAAVAADVTVDRDVDRSREIFAGGIS